MSSFKKKNYPKVYTQMEFVPKSSKTGEDQGSSNDATNDQASKKKLNTTSEEFKIEQPSQSQTQGQDQKNKNGGGSQGKRRNNNNRNGKQNEQIDKNQNNQKQTNDDKQTDQKQSSKNNNRPPKKNNNDNKPNRNNNTNGATHNDETQMNGNGQSSNKRNNKPYEGGQGNGRPQSKRDPKRNNQNKNSSTPSETASINDGSSVASDQIPFNSNKNKNKRRNNRQQQQQNKQKSETNTVSALSDDDDEEEVKEIEDFTNVPKSELADILLDRYKKGRIECPICFNRIKKDAKMWSCRQCHGPLHLGCIQRWILKNPANASGGKNQKYFNWSCPKCNYAYTETLPEYKCFCGKVQNPEYDPYGIPHSCGDKCMKITTKGCIHPCTQICHPGPCHPCTKYGKELVCHCGQKKTMVKCSNQTTSFSCNEPCGKMLSCGKHKCQEICHEGPCQPCPIKIDSECYCGAELQKRKCGEEEYSCGGICGKYKDCGNHKCEAKCHPGACEECPYTPEKMTNCCCGRMSAMSLGFDNRQSCLDPVPVCGLPCGKTMDCGHKCKLSCHPGPCNQCKELVIQFCRCGKDSRRLECWKTKYGDESERSFQCERTCRKYLSCKKHKCQRLCCEATKEHDPHGYHLCLKVCNKDLSCGNHKCSDFCHLGDCKPCGVYITHPLTCVCGKTVKNPPLPCGTRKPECDFPCSRQRDCGHPCRSKCHYDDCLPCDEPVEKMCKCGRKLIKNARCSYQASCQQPCDTVLACGHKCNIVCHVGECDMERGIKGCGAKCGKLRKCGHKCEAPCHPTEEECPNIPCKVMISIHCSCGNREAMIKCGDKEESNLRCDRSCSTMKRFGGFFEKTSTKKSYFPPSLVRFAKNNYSYIVGIEDKLEKMLKNGKDQIDIPLYDKNLGKKTALQILISRHYGMDIEYYLHVKNPMIVVKINTESKMPPMNLSEYVKQVEQGKITPEVLPFQATVKFLNLSQSDRIEELDYVLKAYKGEYYVEKNENKNFVAHFWNKDYAESAITLLRKSHTNFASAILDVNLALQEDEEKMELAGKDVKVQDLTSQDEKINEKQSIFLALNSQNQ